MTTQTTSELELPIDDLIALRHKQATQLHDFNQADAKYKQDCSNRRWWQLMPKCPAIGDYCD